MELQNLQTIFNSKFFRIPDYQRGYSWGEKECKDLWQDINILEKGKDHYTGVLSVTRNKKPADPNISNDDELIYVVDGQQRITSLIILIKAILDAEGMKGKDRINEQDKSDHEKRYIFVRKGAQGEVAVPIFGYERDNPSHVYFKEKILGLKDTDKSVPPQTLYTQNIKRAKDFFAEKVDELDFDELENLFRKITKQLKFNYYQINNELNEFVAFETMNNRGKPLSDLELLKNRLIYLSTLLPDNDDDGKQELRRSINNAWKTIYEYLGKNPQKTLKDDDFLHDHWIMNFSYRRDESKVYKDFLLSKHFTTENVRKKILSYNDIKKYATDIQETVISYYFLHNPYDTACPYSDEVKSWLSKLNRLGFMAFKPLLTSMLTKEADGSRILEILKRAERFNFVAFNVHFHRSNYKDVHIYQSAKEFHTLSGLHVYDFDLTSLKVRDKLKKDKFCENIEEKDEEEKFYHWRGLRYFLYEYELYLQEKAKGEDKVRWEDINTESIEHIYPKTTTDEWVAFGSGEHYLLHDLGNLLLLSHKLNSGIQNGPFNEKQKVFKTGSYSAIEVSQYPNWNPKTVDDRRNKMLVFLWERWGLEEPAKKED